jgi:hypothetical protein
VNVPTTPSTTPAPSTLTPLRSPAPANASPVVRPGIDSWATLLNSRAALSTEQRTAREQLGLPTDRPIVMTGHQAEFWHLGVLAKYLAASAFSLASKAHASWLVVDQDANEPWRISYPTVDAGAIAKREWTIALTGAGRTGFAADTPTGCLPPLAIADGSSLPTIAGPRTDALAVIATSLRAAANEPSAAHQITAATRALLQPIITPDSTLFASSLAKTDLFNTWLDAIARDPRACVAAYNAATQRHPGAHVRPLELTDARVELPLWRLRFGAPRRRVFAHELAAIPRHELAPRALLMTALLRAACCDLFIHGLGGEKYEAVTDDWIQNWASAWTPQTRLAPMAVVSATRYLDFTSTPGLAPDALRIPTPDDIARHLWLAHHAAHDPATLGQSALANQKRQLHTTIAATPRHASQRRDLYTQLLTAERAAIEANPSRLAELRAAAATARARRREADIVFNRTWAFPLHPADTITALARAFEA